MSFRLEDAKLGMTLHLREAGQAWLNAPGMKPLAERLQMRDRLAVLGPMIRGQATVVQGLEADIGVADQIKELAAHPDGCALELSIAQ